MASRVCLWAILEATLILHDKWQPWATFVLGPALCQQQRGKTKYSLWVFYRVFLVFSLLWSNIRNLLLLLHAGNHSSHLTHHASSHVLKLNQVIIRITTIDRVAKMLNEIISVLLFSDIVMSKNVTSDKSMKYLFREKNTIFKTDNMQIYKKS